MKKLLSMLVVSLLVLSMITVVPLIHAEGATISTDKANYTSGETVTIYGSGFDPEVAVSIIVTRPDGSTNGWAVTSDSSGSFTTTYLLDGIEGVYTVVASDGTNTASTTFRDGLGVAHVYSSGPSYPPEKNSFLTTEDVYAYIHTAGGTGTMTVRIYVTDNDAWKSGVSLVDKSGGYETKTLVATTNPAYFGPYLIWSHPTTAGSYDIVVDENQNGIRDPGESVDDSGTGPGFTVTAVVVTATVTFGQVGVGGDFGGTVLTVDGTDYWGVGGLPKTYTWTVGDSHTFAYGSPLVVSAGKQYVWTSTSGLSTAQSGSITVPSGGGSVTGYYKTQYKITVTASPAEAIGGTFDVTYTKCGTVYTLTGQTTTWSDWADATTTVTVSNPQDIINDGTDTRYKFKEYDPSSSATMTGPKTITLVYKTQYYLTVTTAPITGIDAPSGEGWYDKGTYASISTDEYVDIVAGASRWRFDGWTTTDMAEIADPSSTSTTVLMDKAKTVTANYAIQYYLTVVTDPSKLVPIPGEDWYDDCTWVKLTAPQYVPEEAGLNGVRYRFDYWDVDGTSQGTGVNPIDVHMNAPHTATAHFVLQYHLTVQTSPPGVNSPTGEGWYDTGSSAPISTPQYVDIVSGSSRYRFNGWTTTDMSEITSPSSTSTTVYMDKAKTVTANYVVQYYLTVVTSPPGINTPTGEGWYDGGTSASISTDPYVDIVPGSSRYRFDGWTTGTMSEIAVPSSTSTTVLMDKAKTVTANYVIQYYLTVKTDPAGLVTIPGEGWYDECTYVDLTAPSVTCHLFVYWDVDGTVVPGNPIDVHMDAPHTATAHYWPCLEYEQFVTDSSFKKIESFDTVWTPKDTKKTKFKLSATNPGQFYFNIKVHNTWPVPLDKIVISYTIDPDFILHPIQGDPIQVWTGYGITGTRIPATVTYGDSGTITITNIAPCTTLYVTIHMEYKYRGQYFDKATMLAWKASHASNTFTAGYTAWATSPIGPVGPIIGPTSPTTIYEPTKILGL